MGIFKDGNLLNWEDTKKQREHVRNLGIRDFLKMYKLNKNRCDNELKWGDEIEYNIVCLQEKIKCAKLSLKASAVLEEISNHQKLIPQGDIQSMWHHEFNNYMIEGIPSNPYGGELADFRFVENNMNKRRKYLQSFLLPNESLFCINFLRIGCPSFTVPEYTCEPNREGSHFSSRYMPDEVVSKNNMYVTSTHIMRSRRGDNLSCNVNIFHDKHTKIPVEGSQTDHPATVHLDCKAFGMGLCCLQFTLQAANITVGRRIYDQLAPLAPVMLALTASTPAYRGYLVDTDCRWNVTKALSDDRTKEERGISPMKVGQMRVTKLRYDSIASYISEEGGKYNDVDFPYDEQLYQRFRDEKIDHLFSQHIANWFTHDMIAIYPEDEEESFHYDNLCVTIWPSIKLKAPPNESIGWRVEFRTMESQITDFESAAFVCFMNLVSRIILHYDLNFLVPISRIDENMNNAQKRNAVNLEKLWFRKIINKLPNGTTKGISKCNESIYDVCELMTINHIINGNETFPGLIPLINRYVNTMKVDIDTHNLIQKYLGLIGKRASGELLTPASWIRKEVMIHPGYRRDSVITDEINYDLLIKMKKIQDKTIKCKEVLDVYEIFNCEFKNSTENKRSS